MIRGGGWSRLPIARRSMRLARTNPAKTIGLGMAFCVAWARRSRRKAMRVTAIWMRTAFSEVPTKRVISRVCLTPAEEQLDASAVEISNLLCTGIEIVRQEAQHLAGERRGEAACRGASVVRHCERSEAIHIAAWEIWIASSLQRKIALQFCRELLAMTDGGPSVTPERSPPAAPAPPPDRLRHLRPASRPRDSRAPPARSDAPRGRRRWRRTRSG